MSKTMNRVFLVGNLGAKPELRTSKAGKPYARLNLATHRYGKAEEKATTDWHSVFVFGPDAERCSSWLDRGALVFVEGTLSYWKIESEEPSKRYKNAINADSVQFLSYGGGKVAVLEGEQPSENLDNSPPPRNHNAVAHL